jgi:hypothetical protein
MSRRHVDHMEESIRLGAMVYHAPPRLVVKRRTRTGVKKGYFWEILRDNSSDSIIQQSCDSYGTMEEAYIQGSAVLKRILKQS